MNNVLKVGDNPCCSCGLCAVICPQECITIKSNNEGFYRPFIDESKCTNCGLCARVCYKYLDLPDEFKNTFLDKEVYGAWSKNLEVVLNSSSGGVGFEITNYFFQKGYKISGVVFQPERDKCKHIIAQSFDDIKAIRGSKYLQSYTAEAFKLFSKNEKYVVIGTPCQIYGLRKYIKIKKWEDNFILVDFFCHGTPSFLLWEKYKKYIKKKHGLNDFKEVLFRSKQKSSWHKYAMKISDFNGNEYFQPEAFSKDMFFKFFLSDSCLNDSCYNCKLRLDHCASDIRIADFWGGKYSDNKDGVSLVVLNTDQGKQVWSEIETLFDFKKQHYSDLVFSQPHRYICKNGKYLEVIDLFKSDKGLKSIYNKTIKKNFGRKTIMVGVKIIKKIAKIIKKL